MTRPDSPTVRFPAGFDAQLLSGVKIGDVIAGDYQIERELGRGGMGVVFAARQLRLDRLVAIKLMRGTSDDDARAVERLRREAKAAGRLQSEHVARVFDVGTLESGAPFIVMEYLDGPDLRQALENDSLTITLAIDYLLQACEALAEAHRSGIVHLDLKPANLVIAHQPGGVSCVKVLDFGISKVVGMVSAEPLTERTNRYGSLPYMAPEQLRGKDVDARTDIWALGVLLFEMLTGHRLFNGDTWAEVCAQVLNEAGSVLDTQELVLPEGLKAILRRCLGRNPMERYSNVAELALELAPFGTTRARVSLERIVKLATTNTAPVVTPQPPPPAPQPAPVPRPDFHTTKPTVIAVGTKPMRPFLIGTGVGIAFASVVATSLALRGERLTQQEQALVPRNVPAPPAAAAPAPPAAAAPAPPAAAALVPTPAAAPAPTPAAPPGAAPSANSRAAAVVAVQRPAPQPRAPGPPKLAEASGSHEPTAPEPTSEAPDGGPGAGQPPASNFELSDIVFKSKKRSQK
jgi:serine/threonine-protein kinase